MKAPVDLELVDWDVADTKFLINTEGCGYPNLGVNCTIFARKYGYGHFFNLFKLAILKQSNF